MGDTSSSNLEQMLEDAKLYRLVNSLIVAHLRDNSLSKAASAVATATMTPLDTEAPHNRLLELVAKGLAVEQGETLRSGVSSALLESGTSTSAAYGSIPVSRAVSVDFGAVPDAKGLSKIFLKHETRRISEHKNVARCARFSPDGKFIATGSADNSIKLFEVLKIKQMMQSDTKDGPVRPVIRTFYDHVQSINDVDFHPHGTILISGAKDCTIKFFDLSKTAAKRAYRVIQDTHNVRSVSFHPSGDFLLAGTDHPIPHLYDVSTFQCYLSANAPELGGNGSINQDSTLKLWEVGSGRMVKQYLGATHKQLRCQAIFNNTEEFIISIDELSNEIVIWDALSSEIVARWTSNHTGAPRWLEHSPTEAAFVSCGTDRSVRFWKETL